MTLRAHDSHRNRPSGDAETWSGGKGHCAATKPCPGGCACGDEVKAEMEET